MTTSIITSMTTRMSTKLTTNLRTGLLLVFTAMTMAASLSGCIIETTSGPPKNTCPDNRYFQVYWSVAADASSPTYTCNQAPPFSHVQLLTNTGSYEVGKACTATNYMGFTFDWAGSTDDGIPAGTYVISADLMATDGVTSLSAAPGPGSQYQIGNCDPLTVAFTFDLN